LCDESAAKYFPFIDLANPANAVPAIFSSCRKVFHAIEVNGHILSLLLCGFLADGVPLVDVVNASDFQIMGALVGKGYCENQE